VLEKAGVPAAAGVGGDPIRRPAALAILKSPPLGDLTFSLELKSTAPADLDVRDVLLIVGYQSPSQFYYVHISTSIAELADCLRLNPDECVIGALGKEATCDKTSRARVSRSNFFALSAVLSLMTGFFLRSVSMLC
jgi:hypothetical protein